jgi:hypothetical protein
VYLSFQYQRRIENRDENDKFVLGKRDLHLFFLNRKWENNREENWLGTSKEIEKFIEESEKFIEEREKFIEEREKFIEEREKFIEERSL